METNLSNYSPWERHKQYVNDYVLWYGKVCLIAYPFLAPQMTVRTVQKHKI